MNPQNDQSMPRTVIGGRHGSPALTIAFPFSRVVTNNDAELREAVADLATLVARLAEHSQSGDAAALGVVRTAAEELAARVNAT
jgi:ABC-type transporter Mla subunit MlaD